MRARNPGRWKAPAGATAVAVLAHAWALGLWASFVPEGPVLAVTDDAPPGRTVAVTFEVRRIAAAAAMADARDIGAMPATAPARTLRAPAVPAASRAVPAVPTPSPDEAAARESTPRGPVDGAPAAAEAGSTTPPAAGGATPEFADPASWADATPPPLGPSPPAPPTYRTAPPPSLELRYAVRRGSAAGTARISWRIDADGRYELEMQGADGDPADTPRARGATGATAALAPHWTSRGTLDAAGIAPERFAVSRRGRERHAANFRRDVGIISFAGPSRTWPLAGGAQDRLSWMVQLAAVLQADAALAAVGAQISMMVVGAHGDAGLWTFTVQRQVVVEGPGGEALPAWQLQRDSSQAHDPQVQVWLAPSLHHLPVRLRLTLPRTGESTEMHLRALQAP